MRKNTPARRKGAVKVILFGLLAAAVILLAGALGRRSADTAIRAGTNEALSVWTFNSCRM